MKEKILKVIAKLAETNITKSNKTTCLAWTYQPKIPDNIQNMDKEK